MQVPYEHSIFISDPDNLPSRIIISILQNRKLRPQEPHSQQCPTILSSATLSLRSLPGRGWGALLVFTPSLSLQTSKGQKQGSWSLLGASGELGGRMWLPTWKSRNYKHGRLAKTNQTHKKISPSFGLGASRNPDRLFPWFRLSAVTTLARLTSHMVSGVLVWPAP